MKLNRNLILLTGVSFLAFDSAIAESTTTIIITAEKKTESILEVPIAVSSLSEQQISDYNIKSFTDFADKIPNLAFAYGNGATGVSNSRTLSIRGISGANSISGSSTTGFYIDDTPIPASLDPKILDLSDIEVLKGPQGTLYGEGSLGGNIRLITKSPNLSENEYTFQVDTGLTSHGGSLDYGDDIYTNFVIVPDKIATRIDFFSNNNAGYLTRTYLDNNQKISVGNQGNEISYGYSISTLFKITDNLDSTLRIISQNKQDQGLPETFAPLPNFTPNYTIDRQYNIETGDTDRWITPSLEVSYHENNWNFTSTINYLYRHTHDIEDSTIGTEQFLTFIGVNVPDQPYMWVGYRSQEEYSNENRLSFETNFNLSGTVGTFFSENHTDYVIPATDSSDLKKLGYWPNNILWASEMTSSEEDKAIFGELYYKFFDDFTLTIGGRYYWLNQGSNFVATGITNGGSVNGPTTYNSESGLSPKIALSYQIDDNGMIYSSISKGFRAGGSGQTVIPSCESSLKQIGLSPEGATKFDSDTIWNYEIGSKYKIDDLIITGAAFHLNWNKIQQNVFLPSCSFYIETNAGAAEVNGGELEIAGNITSDFQIRTSFGYEDAKITDQGTSGQLPGSRIYQTPKWTISTGFVYNQKLDEVLTGFLEGDYNYTGNSISTNSGVNLSLVRPSYSIINTRIGIRWDNSELSFNIHNLTNEKPNLGDIGYIGFEQYTNNGNPLPQVVTLLPLTATVQYRWSF